MPRKLRLTTFGRMSISRTRPSLKAEYKRRLLNCEVARAVTSALESIFLKTKGNGKGSARSQFGVRYGVKGDVHAVDVKAQYLSSVCAHK